MSSELMFIQVIDTQQIDQCKLIAIFRIDLTNKGLYKYYRYYALAKAFM